MKTEILDLNRSDRCDKEMACFVFFMVDGLQIKYDAVTGDT